jgi:predicted Zn finger-like uncharacterized protein
MILTCPECGTQYVVKDGAIPPGGRQVRCASCKHSWHQDPEATAELELDEAAEVGAAPVPETEEQFEQAAAPASAAAEAGIEPEPEPAGYRPLMDSPVETQETDDRISDVHTSAGGEAWPVETAPAEVATVEDEFAPFGPRDYVEEEPKRRVLPLILLVLLVAAAAIAFWFLAPLEWKSRLGIAQAGETPLTLSLTHHDRQALASGNELLAITGRVINPTGKTQAVPPIRAQLSKSSGEVVYSWTISPPAQRLSPGASATFNSAEVNVPPGGEQLTVTLGAPRA